MSIDSICQILIVLFGAPAIWLIGRLEHWRRWGYVFGLLGQPVWVYVTVKEGQWGMFVLTLWYTYSWLQGLMNYWNKKD